MLVADLVLLPTTPGAADLWALQESITVLAEAQAMRPVNGMVVFNRLDRTSLARMARRAVDDFNVPILDATLGARVAFGEAILAGLGVVQHSPSSQAAHEARRLTKAVLAVLGGN
jgi:chromosome partitioning protein